MDGGKYVVALTRQEGRPAAAAPAQGSPVFTVRGQYAARGWTEWTQGFQYGVHGEPGVAFEVVLVEVAADLHRFGAGRWGGGLESEDRKKRQGGECCQQGPFNDHDVPR